jgi:hypothetical protein
MKVSREKEPIQMKAEVFLEIVSYAAVFKKEQLIDNSL